MTDKEKVLKRILEQSCKTFSLQKLSERRNGYGANFVVGRSSGTVIKDGPWLGVSIEPNAIWYSDVPRPIREGVVSFSAPTLRGFLEKFISRELGHTTIPKKYLWPRRICLKRDWKIPGHHRWKSSENLNSSRPGFAVIVEYLEKTRYLPRGEDIYRFLNSSVVREACIELDMPEENPNEEYVGEFAKPIAKTDHPPLGQIWQMVAKAVFTGGREPRRIPSK